MNASEKLYLNKSAGKIAANWWANLLKKTITNGSVNTKNRTSKMIIESLYENKSSFDANIDFFEYLLASKIDKIIINGGVFGAFTGDDESYGFKLINQCLRESGLDPDGIGWPPETEMDVSSESIMIYEEYSPDGELIWRAERFPPIM